MAESKVAKKDFVKNVLTDEVKYIVGILIFIFSIVKPFFGAVQDLALIKADITNINSNHEAHIQDLTQNIKDIKEQQVDQQKQIIDLQRQIITLIGRK